MKTTTLSFLLIGFAFACGQAGENTSATGTAALSSNVTRTVNEVAITEGTPVTTADLEISGMSCMMSCGRAVEKALAGLPGITKTTIEFNEGDAADHAIVTYDESKVSDAQMVEAVGKVHDGAYQVVAVKITKQKLAAGSTPAAEEQTEKSKAEAEVNAAAVSGLIPGLLELLSRVTRL